MDTPDPRNRNSHRTNNVRWNTALKGNLPLKMTPLRIWTSKAQNASRASSVLSCIMREPWIISYLSASVPSDHSRPPPYSTQMKPSTKFLITAPLTPRMTFSIALASCSYVRILTQGSTMRARDAADPERIFSSLKMRPCSNGTDLC